MGASVGTDTGKKSYDVELNVVPFIDLMSCLVSFLLATAVWSAYTQLNIRPKGLTKEATEQTNPDDKPFLSVLITKNEIWAGYGTMAAPGDRRQIAKSGGEYDWTGLDTVLKEFRELPIFTDREDIEISAVEGVVYQDIMSGMDVAKSASFDDIGLVDPGSLHVKFME